MKTVLFLTFFLSLNALAAPQMNCFDLAVNTRKLSKEAAISLCAGATSNAPVICYDLAGTRGLETSLDKILLCRGAVDNTAISCFDLGASRKLTASEAIDLCGSSNLK